MMCPTPVSNWSAKAVTIARLHFATLPGRPRLVLQPVNLFGVALENQQRAGHGAQLVGPSGIGDHGIVDSLRQRLHGRGQTAQRSRDGPPHEEACQQTEQNARTGDPGERRQRPLDRAGGAGLRLLADPLGYPRDILQDVRVSLPRVIEHAGQYHPLGAFAKQQVVAGEQTAVAENDIANFDELPADFSPLLPDLVTRSAGRQSLQDRFGGLQRFLEAFPHGRSLLLLRLRQILAGDVLDLSLITQQLVSVLERRIGSLEDGREWVI